MSSLFMTFFYLLTALLGMGLFGILKWLLVVAEPDEWLIRVRGGQLVEAGVGITLWRWPGDSLAKFSSTHQRVAFCAEALSSERIRVEIRGFFFWTVSRDPEGPFRAFQNLGIANLLSPPPELKHPKHLLTTAQYRAFQQVVVSLVQRNSSKLRLGKLMERQDEFIDGLGSMLRESLEPLGVEVTQVQLLSVIPADGDLLSKLSAGEKARIQEESAKVRLATEERIRQQELKIATRQAKEEAEAQREKELHQAKLEVELESRKSDLEEQKRAIELRELDGQHMLEEHKLQLRHDREMLVETFTSARLEAQLQRRRQETAFQMEKLQNEAETTRITRLADLAVEERKSPEVRKHELGRFTAQKVAETLRIGNAKWVSVGGDSPMAGLAAMLEGMRQLAGVSDAQEVGEGARTQ